MQSHSTKPATTGGTTTPPTGNLPPLLYQQPATAYLICQAWQAAHEGRVTGWGCVAGLLDCINNPTLDPESADALDFLAVLARFRGAMAKGGQ